jgi:exonuclease III
MTDSKRNTGHAGGRGRALWHPPAEEKADFGFGLEGLDSDMPCGLRVGTYNMGQGYSDKIERVLRRATHLSLDVMAITEIGDPKIDARLIRRYGFSFLVCAKKHAGVMLVFRQSMAAHLRRPLDTGTDGRLVGGYFDLGGKTCLLASVYVHSGVDRMAVGSDDIISVQALYARILRWSSDRLVHRALIMGDFNETCSPMDRSENLHGSLYRRCISSLLDDGFIDCFRSLHSEPGFTCQTPVPGRLALSRIDYILAKGWGYPPSRSCAVDDFLVLSRHQLLWSEVGGSDVLVEDNQVVRPHLPNLRRARPAQRLAMANCMGDDIDHHSTWFSNLAVGSPKVMDDFAEGLISIATRACGKHLPSTGGPPHRSAKAKSLRLQREHLSQIRACAVRVRARHQSFDGAEWHSVLRGHHAAAARSWGNPATHWNQWISAADSAIREVRRLERAELGRMKSTRNDAWIDNEKAEVHSMLRNRKPELLSVVDPSNNKLATSPADVERVLVTHFRSVLNGENDHIEADSPNDAALRSTVYKVNTAINPNWFNELMSPASDNEVLRCLRSGKYVVAAGGNDKISTGVWRCAAELDDRVLSALTLFTNACLEKRVMPSSGKLSVLVPFLKKASEERSTSNLRPVSLQSGLTKILCKLLANRLTLILASHSILHEAQEAFLSGRSSFRCVDICLDAWENSKQNKHLCVNVFYDIRAAYDSVRHQDLISALRRLAMPQSFLDFVASSLAGLSSCVRTAYGNSAWFAVTRSVRQGDPLAPILYVIFMDPLHCGLETNPLYDGAQDGYVFAGRSIASKGFADDTWIVSGSIDGLKRMHRWVVAFCKLNGMRLHEGKTLYVGRTESQGQVPDGIISINSVPIKPVPLGTSVRYLGAQISMDLNTDDQCAQIASTIGFYCHTALKFHMAVEQAVSFFNTYLMSKIELGLRFASPSSSDTKSWDSSLAKAISTLAGSPRVMKAEALSISLELMLPSSLEKLVKISELVIRLNSSRSASTHCAQQRWLAADTDASYSSKARLVAAVSAARKIGITISKCPVRRSFSVADNMPAFGLRRGSNLHGSVVSVVFGSRCLWGLSLTAQPVTVYAAASSPTRTVDPSNSQPSGWGVCVENGWLQSVASPLPSETKAREKALKLAVAFGDQITPFYPGGVYVCRLIALVHALLSVPVLCPLRVVCAQGPIDAMHWFRSATMDRHKLKLCGRPILAILEDLITVRRQHGGLTTFERFNKDGSAPDVAGMACAKFWADKGRSKLSPPATELPKQSSRDFVSCAIGSKPVLANVRHAVRSQLHLDLISRWSNSESQSAFCSEASAEFMASLRLLVSEGDLRQCHLQFGLRAITDTIQFRVDEGDDGKRVFSSVPCSRCDSADTDTYHLFACDHDDSVNARQELVDVILAEISHADGSRKWIDQQEGLPLMAVIKALFGSSSDSQQLRVTLGAFSKDEFSNAMSITAISDSELWPTVSRGLRIALVSHAYDQWSKRDK